MNESHWTVESILKKEQRQCHSAPLQSSSVLPFYESLYQLPEDSKSWAQISCLCLSQCQ